MSMLTSMMLAEELSGWLDEKTNGRELPNVAQEWVGVAILQHASDISNAILVLLKASLPGPALTLARSLFEGYVRGVWLLNFASALEIEKFVEGECPKFNEILSAIGNGNESGGAWIHANKNANWKNFHGLTHGGSEHVKRRNTQDAIEPNYPEQELEALVQFGIEVQLRIGAELLSLMNDELALEQLNERAESIRSLALKNSS